MDLVSQLTIQVHNSFPQFGTTFGWYLLRAGGEGQSMFTTLSQT